jgi:hypothetical protein
VGEVERCERDLWWNHLKKSGWLRHLRTALLFDEHQVLLRLRQLDRKRLITLYLSGFPIVCGDLYVDASRCSVTEFLHLVEGLCLLVPDPYFEYLMLSHAQVKTLTKFIDAPSTPLVRRCRML